MRSARTLNSYWNERLDPLDWKRVSVSAENRHWVEAFETFLTPDTRDAIESLGDLRGTRLLELGCGPGVGALHLVRRGADVTGIDISDRRCVAASRVLARSGPVDRSRFCAAGAGRLPFRDATFDRVFCRDVLMYADPAAVVAECHRVLTPGGQAVFVESLAGNPLMRWYRERTSPPDYRGFTRHLSFDEVTRLHGTLRLVESRPYYLFSLAAFLALFVFRSTALCKICLAVFHPLDRRLLDRFPRLSRFAWRGVAVYRKPDSSTVVGDEPSAARRRVDERPSSEGEIRERCPAAATRT